MHVQDFSLWYGDFQALFNVDLDIRAATSFDEVGDLGPGGTIRAMIDLGDAIAVADMGGDRIRIFPDDPPREN